MNCRLHAGILICCMLVLFGQSLADDKVVVPLIGYTELQTNLAGGRHANIRTMRAMLIRRDGTDRQSIGQELANEADAWTQFAGWSPDGTMAIIGRGWQDSENARWEEEHKSFRFTPGKWLVDSCLINLSTGATTNVTSVDRVSHYNSGLFFMPDRKRLGFTALINGISKPFVMDVDGRNKQDLSGKDAGFAYGYSASPDGKLISYHENYQIYIAKADGTDKRHIKTGHQFDFAPRWSPDGQWLLFVSGEHYNCHPHIVRADGTGLRKLADRNGYRGVMEFLDVFDFHGGSSDIPVWSVDGKSVYYTAQVVSAVELFRVPLDGPSEQLTRSMPGTTHYHPQPSSDGEWLLYGSKRDGIRQIFARRMSDGAEQQITHVPVGRAAIWPHWQPTAEITVHSK